MTKSQRREAARAAMMKAETVRRRGQLVSIVVGSALAVGIIVAAVVVFKTADPGDKPSAAASESAGETPSATPFPPLPAGADPALGSKPKASAGTGDLAKLTVTPLIEGAGAATVAGQNITVNYVGVSYKTGDEFDSSWKRSEPFEFQLGAGNVIKGWDQGLVGVKVGSRIQLDIPADLAYGDDTSGGAPAGPLRFIVDVLAAQ